MAKKNISLSSMINSEIHRPRTKSGFVLYPKIKNYTGVNEGGELATKAEADPVYQNSVGRNYNSPTNIKRIFITAKRVTVEYHTGPIKAGVSGDRWATTLIKDSNTGLSLYEIAEKIATYDHDRHIYAVDSSINSKAVAPTQYVVSGTFNIGNHPYACSNVEEIYFDWGVLLSAEVAPYFNELLHGATPADIANTFATFSSSVVTESNMPINLFAAQSAGGSKDLRKKYPRLREITFISNLDDIIISPDVKGYLTTVEDEKLGKPYCTWYELNKELIASSNTCTIRGNMTAEVKNPLPDFVVKSNQYLFDEDKLDAYAKAYADKITSLIRQSKYGSTEEVSGETTATDFEMSEIEKRLLEIESKYNSDVMYVVWQYAFNGAGISIKNMQRVLHRITKPNRTRLAEKLNITL